MLRIRNLKKQYGERTVLDIDFLQVKKGETVVVVGPNGSGKSTLLKIVGGVIKNDGGEVSLGGEAYYMPQQSVPFGKTLRKNLLFSVKKKENKKELCDEMLRKMELFHLAEKNARGLSGGECQRLSLARVLMNEGELLLLDEPSSAADIEGTEIIEKAIAEYKEKTGCAILMTTHSPRQAKKLGDRIIMLHKGKIVEEGSAEELLFSPTTAWGKKFIDMWKIG